MRKFDSGATRDTDENKLDFEGFLSPLVLHRYAEYLNKHRTQADGKLRDSDNWQKGIPLAVYMKSGWRHFFDWWWGHRGAPSLKDRIEESICGLLFNAMGYLHECLKSKAAPFPTGARSGRITSDEYNAAEIDGPELYVPQPGDVVGIKPRSSISDTYRMRIEEANYSGKVDEELDTCSDVYRVNLAFHVDVNLYADEMQLLKRED